MSKYTPIAPADVLCAPVVYRELGNKIRKLERFETSLEFFDVALEKNPLDLRSLQGRSICRAQLCKYKEAMKDCMTMLEASPDNMLALGMKSLITYLQCEFEEAMVQNVRMSLLRKKPDNFVVGVMHCEDAIRNGIGVRAGVPLRDHFKIIRNIAWRKSLAKPVELQPRNKPKKKDRTQEWFIKKPTQGKRMTKISECRKVKSLKVLIDDQDEANEIEDSDVHVQVSEISLIRDSLHSLKASSTNIPPCPPFPYKPIQNHTTNIQNFMAERYLDRMRFDKKFLKRLVTDPGVYCQNENVAKRIVRMAKRSHNHIDMNQELLRARRPFYFLRYRDAKVTGKLKERQDERENGIKNFCKTEADNILSKLRQAAEQWHMRKFINYSEKLFTFCKSTEKKYLPHRESYLQKMYAAARDAFYKIKSIPEHLTPEEGQGRIAVLLGLPASRQPSSDFLKDQFKDQFKDMRKGCTGFEERVKTASSVEELIWLYHEISRFQYDLKVFEMAKSYATKCVREADLVKDYKWGVNGLFRLAKCHIAMKNRNGAKTELKLAKKLAKKLNDEALDDFLTKCLNVLMDIPIEGVEPSEKVLQKRTQRILRLLKTEGMKNQAAHLFQRMNALPESRRMPIVPGVVFTPEKKAPPPVPVVEAASNIPVVEKKPPVISHETRKEFLKLLQID